jgi:hypothetical protein
MGPGTSKECDTGTIPFAETIPVDGRIEYKDARVAGAVREDSVSDPTPPADRPALIAMDSPEDEPPGTFEIQLQRFSTSIM